MTPEERYRAGLSAHRPIRGRHKKPKDNQQEEEAPEDVLPFDLPVARDPADEKRLKYNEALSKKRKRARMDRGF